MRRNARNPARHCRLAAPDHDDPIVEDLRSFAHDLGISGCSVMSKNELVESLRQCYVLTMLRTESHPPRVRRP